MIIMETSILSILGLGLLLGLRHSLDADHLIAVSTIATRTKSSLKAGVTGAFWGIGHSVTILLIGAIVLLIKVPIPEQLDSLFGWIVALLLIFLGLKTIRVSRNLNTLFQDKSSLKKYHSRSFFIGLIHGLAGSAALLLLILNKVDDVATGMLFLTLFGIGSIIGMFLCAMMFSIPIRVAKTEKIQKGVLFTIGLLSTCFGISLFF
jgi:sulfite exporter TauE/SafE